MGNLEFQDPIDAKTTESCRVSNPLVLDQISKLLGISSEVLERVLTNKSQMIRRDVFTNILMADQASHQRDQLMEVLYSVLFSYVVEASNHKLGPSEGALSKNLLEGGFSVVQLDTPGWQTKNLERPGSGMLVLSTERFENFCVNFQSDLIDCWISRDRFSNSSTSSLRIAEDGGDVRLREVEIIDRSNILRLLRGGPFGTASDNKPEGVLGVLENGCQNAEYGVTGNDADGMILHSLKEEFESNQRFIVNPDIRTPAVFGIRHWSGNATYDVRGFTETNLDRLDSEFLMSMRNSEDNFVSKLFNGPNLNELNHPQDQEVVMDAQVSNAPLRRVSAFKGMGMSFGQFTEGEDWEGKGKILSLTGQLNGTLSNLIKVIDRCRPWVVLCLRPNDYSQPNSFDSKRIKSQLGRMDLLALIERKGSGREWVADLGVAELMSEEGIEGDIAGWFRNLGFGEEDFFVGKSRVWMTEASWRVVKDRFIARAPIPKSSSDEKQPSYLDPYPDSQSYMTPSIGGGDGGGDSVENLVKDKEGFGNYDTPLTPLPYQGTYDESTYGTAVQKSKNDVWPNEDGKKGVTMDSNLPGGGGTGKAPGANLQRKKSIAVVEEESISRSRRIWLIIVWTLTWWIPSAALSYIGRMKRPDIRLAWREKLTLCILIFFLCGVVIFYICIFGKLLCPDYDKVWNTKELGYHDGTNDFWVAVRGEVYDITSFWKGQHSDISGEDVTQDDMITLAGQDLTEYFPIPLTLACPSLVTDQNLALTDANFTAEVTIAVHTSGILQSDTSSALYKTDWYTQTFLPKMVTMHKGPLVWSKGAVSSGYDNDGRIWAIYDDGIYDLSDYLNTVNLNSDNSAYKFLDSDLTNIWQQQPGQDVTKLVEALDMNATDWDTNFQCMRNLFYVGEVDFRDTPRCKVQNILLLVFPCIMVTVIASKFLAALQLGSKRQPELRDKFVICQIPCYTEGEDSIKKTIDSLATLKYDDKRKLLFLICDGMIIGGGNDRPTPRIVLDILGVDPKEDPEPCLFKSVGEGSKQVNYGKVYSGLYEVEGHVVPYVVVVKVGKPSERSKPGNRGKRDSQILLLRFLNRAHFNAEMNPLELEIYHQIKIVIGVDPVLYEYILMIDADTEVLPDSLNRLVACAADDSKIIGICGETKLSNEQETWWTMIQVYEYYISHHMAKAFESLFGSVTCLPGCFSMYRVRSADKGRPLIISNLIIDDYSENNVDTLHKKNLLSLGEDRYLTTLILKHFPHYKTKFTADAQALTSAPESWGVLLSQRRRWINSTVHNLAELVFLPDLCGFCCFSMRFVVFIDLLGTLILPATFGYLVYLIIEVSLGKEAVPIIALAMLAAVYGLQAIIFLLKRQWQFIGWLVVYIIAYPVYSFLLPVYSFWCFDDFSWGNTRIVVGEGRNKKILNDDEPYDDSIIPMAKFSDYEKVVLARENDMGSQPPPFRDGSVAGDFHPDTKSLGPPAHSRYNSVQSFSPTLHNNFPPAPASLYNAPVAYQSGRSVAGSISGLPMNPAMYSAAPSMYGFPPPMLPYAPSGYSPSYAGSEFGHIQPPSAPHNSQAFLGNTSASVLSFGQHLAQAPTPSQSSNPSDEEIKSAIKAFLATQDLMTVTKRSTRDALNGLFPRADLSGRKAFINTTIDEILQGQA